jgi:predicted transcriptional regulator of viral defense system
VLFQKINSLPDKTWSISDLEKTENINPRNITPTLARLTRRGLLVRVARGKYKSAPAKQEEAMPTFTDNGINPSSIRGRMFDLLYANPKRCFTCEEVAKALRCETNAARQAAYVLTKDQMIIRQKHGEYRAVTDEDMGGVSF